MTDDANGPALRLPQRSAHASVAGYHYQFAYTALRWLECDDSTTLYCEGNEDLDELNGSGHVDEVQLRNLSSKVGQRSESTRKVLANFAAAFCDHHRAGRSCRLVFRTTAELAGDDDTELARWMVGKSYDEGGLREHFEAISEVKFADKEYLDAHRVWAIFFGSVLWAFSEPTLQESQRLLLDRIGDSPRARALSPETVSASMIAEILRCSGRPTLVERSLSSIQLDILLNDLWLSAAIEECGSQEAQRGVYLASHRDDRGAAYVALFPDDEERLLVGFRSACELLAQHPQGSKVHSLHELVEGLEGKKFLSDAGFDVYAAIDCGGRSPTQSDDELRAQLAPYLEARRPVAIHMVDSIETEVTMSALSSESASTTPFASDELASELARYVAKSILQAWCSRQFTPTMKAIHRKVRVVADLAEREYFTQDHRPQWLLL
ncbi:MAG: hypothetical protein ABI627_18985 [Polyangiaceae bacterium]